MTFHSWRNLSKAQEGDGISPTLHSAEGNIDCLCTRFVIQQSPAEQEVN